MPPGRTKLISTSSVLGTGTHKLYNVKYYWYFQRGLCSHCSAQLKRVGMILHSFNRVTGRQFCQIAQKSMVDNIIYTKLVLNCYGHGGLDLSQQIKPHHNWDLTQK